MSDWISWNPGTRVAHNGPPLSKKTLIDVKLANGDVFYGLSVGRFNKWYNPWTQMEPGNLMDNPIVAFRVSSVQRRDWWSRFTKWLRGSLS